MTKRLVVVVWITAALGAAAWGAAPNATVRQLTYARGDEAGRLRVDAIPGDPGATNGHVTLFVSQQDGALVDFWPNTPTLPSVRQLGDDRLIDGVWRIAVDLRTTDATLNLDPAVVERIPDGVRATRIGRLPSGQVRLTTEYRLSPDTTRVYIRDELECTHGRVGVRVNRDIRWGNVDVFADGVGRVTPPHRARAAWVGRHGASGDLRLEVDASALTLRVGDRTPGLNTPLALTSDVLELDRGDRWSTEGTLSYGALPLSGGSPPAETEARYPLTVTVVDENGAPLPAKLGITGVGDTPTPDFGNDGGLSGSSRFVWSGAGRFALRLPAGTYDLLASSGIERAIARWRARVEGGRIHEFSGTLGRVIETPGRIAADLHLHQSPSVDADIGFVERVIAIAAEGIELAVATDHYVTSDLGPTIDALRRSGRLTRPLRSLVGSEISTTGRRFGHFNAFPMQLGAHVHYHDTDPKRLFGEMRALVPEGIIQVNHPRMGGLGYFNAMQYDPETAAPSSDHAQEYSADFDALEVFNGLDAVDLSQLRPAFADWFSLLAAGHHVVATGNSDSHKLAFVDPGLPHNLIGWGTAADDDADASAPTAAVLAGLKQGRVLVTSGPIIDADIAGTGPGDTHHATQASVPLNIIVRAAPWIDVSFVEVRSGARGTVLERRKIAPSTSTTRFSGVFSIPASAGFVVVTAGGAQPLPTVYHPGTLPFAFTNPIFITHGAESPAQPR